MIKLLSQKMKRINKTDLHELNTDKPMTVTLFIDDKEPFYNQFFCFDTAPCIKDSNNPFYDAQFSALENRYLAQRPAFSLKNVLSGKWMDDTEDWLSDQFPGRDFFVRAKATAEYLLGKRTIGGAVIGADGQYFDAAYLHADPDQWQKNPARVPSR